MIMKLSNIQKLRVYISVSDTMLAVRNYYILAFES